MCCDETVEYSVCDGWPNRDVGGWKLRSLACSTTTTGNAGKYPGI